MERSGIDSNHTQAARNSPMKTSHDVGTIKLKSRDKILNQIKEEGKINVHQSQIVLDLGVKNSSPQNLNTAARAIRASPDLTKSYDNFDKSKKRLMGKNEQISMASQIVSPTMRNNETDSSKHNAIYSSAVEIMQTKQGTANSNRDHATRNSMHLTSNDKDGRLGNDSKMAVSQVPPNNAQGRSQNVIQEN